MPSLLEWLVQNEPSFRKSRLPSLYSDLNVQNVTNPEGFAANAATWQAGLVKAALAAQLPTEQHLILESSEELLNVLVSHDFGRPSGLGLVFDDAVRNGKMVPLKDFQTAETSIYHRPWIPSAMMVFRWSLRQFGLSGQSSYDASGRLRTASLVLVEALEEVSKQIMSAHQAQSKTVVDNVMTREAFMKNLCPIPLPDRDLDVLLLFLARDKQALSYSSTTGTIKLKSANSALPEPVTEEDTTIANLKSLISSLNDQITALKQRISTLQAAASTSLRAGHKVSALSALRSKKLAERNLAQRTETLGQLEQVYTSIENAVDQVAIVQAFKDSTGVLKGLNKKIGGVEEVDDVMDALREQMGKVDEVGQVINEPLDGKGVLDEAEVDEEFEEMEREERRRKEEKEAEMTARRLAEIGQGVGGSEGTKAANVEKELGRSVDGLKEMTIDTSPEHAKRQEGQERVAEKA